MTEGSLSAEQALADVDELVDILVSCHPDPFIGGGGRVAFYRRVDELRRSIPDGGVTVEELRRGLRPLVASLRDGHTAIWDSPEVMTGRFWLEWGVVEESLYVAAAFRAGEEPLLGARLETVAGVAADELRRRVAGLWGCENPSAELTRLAWVVSRPALLDELVDVGSAPVRFAMRTPEGGRVEIALEASAEPTRT